MSQAGHASGQGRRGGRSLGGARDTGRRSGGRTGDQYSQRGSTWTNNGAAAASSAASSATSASSVTPASASSAATNSGRFQTDTDISASSHLSNVRELQQWVDDSGTESVPQGVDLDSLGEGNHKEGSWDQFKTNREKFGVTTSYDETFYTTAINRSHPEYLRRERKAAQLAADIEKQSHGGNVHIAEERGVDLNDASVDEEDKYSGVVRGVASMTANEKQQQQQPQPARGPGGTFEKFLEMEAKASNASQQQASSTSKKFNQLNDLRQFSADYKIDAPVPPDLAPLLGRGATSTTTNTPANKVNAAQTSAAEAPSDSAPSDQASKPKKKYNFASSLQKKVYFKPDATVTTAHILPARHFVPPMPHMMPFVPGTSPGPGHMPTGTVPGVAPGSIPGPLAPGSPAQVPIPTPVSLAPAAHQPPESRPLRPIGQLFDYFKHMEATGNVPPLPFTVPPTWNVEGSADFHEQFMPPMHRVLPVMPPPFSMMYMR